MKKISKYLYVVLTAYCLLLNVNCNAQTEHPSVYFKNYTGLATISAKEVMEIDTLKAHLKTSEFVVVSFELTLTVNGKHIKTLVCKSNVLSNEAKTLLKQAVSGSKIFIDNIKATENKSKPIRGLKPYRFKSVKTL